MTEHTPDAAAAPGTSRVGRRCLVISLLVAAAWYAADQLSKLWVVENLPIGRQYPVIPGLLWWEHIRNSGAAFSLGSNFTWVFTIVMAVVIVAILWNLRRVRVLVGGPRPFLLELPRRRLTPSNPHQLLVLMLTTSLLMTAIATIFLRNQLRPIQRLARAAEAFGRGRIEPYRPAGALEVRSAGAAFLDMRNRIERQNEQRALMLSGVGHDLRTPLTRLKLGLSMLSPDMPPEPGEIADMERDVTELKNRFLVVQALEAVRALEQGVLTDDVRRWGSVRGGGGGRRRPLPRPARRQRQRASGGALGLERRRGPAEGRPRDRRGPYRNGRLRLQPPTRVVLRRGHARPAERDDRLLPDVPLRRSLQS